MPDRHDAPTDDEPTENSVSKGLLSRRRLVQIGGAGLSLTALGVAGASAGEDDPSNTIVVDGTETTGTASYEFLVTDGAAVHPDLGSNESGDRIDGGHVTGDLGAEVHAYRFGGTLSYLDVEGAAEVSLYYGGGPSPATDRLEVVSTADGEVDYRIESTDPVTKVLSETERPADADDAVTETDDGTWLVDGATRNGGGDTYDFSGSIDRFEPVTGDFTLFFNGEETTVTELTGQEAPEEVEEEPADPNPDREHWYSFEATGDAYADYYIEVEDGGDLIPSTVDDATIVDGAHWINDDGTKAAGRVQPGETHAYAFDTLVADVTIEGDAHPTVNGSDSGLDYYPRDSATGDAWKTGFPWQDGDRTATEPAPDGVALGGGPGYDRIVTRADADVVVDGASDLASALSGASAGDVVFVDGSATIDTGGRSMDVPDGVTLASNRGEDGAPGALLYTDETPQIMLRPQTDARVTGLRLRGHSPGRTVTYRDGISFDTPTYALSLEGGDVEVDNCEVWGWPDRAIAVKRSRGHVHHNYIYDNNGQGLGYGVAANKECLIEYNYFHNNRHSVTCAYNAPGYTARYNHFSPVSVMHICDVHDPFEGDTTIESNIVENGESRTWDNPAAEGVAGYSGGFDGGSLAVADNWFFDEGSAYFDSFAEVSDGGNVYGDEGAHDPTDVIANHPGMADRPWL